MSTFFKLKELKCKCGECESTGEEMDHNFMSAIDVLRGKCGFPFVVTSAYRCPEHNAKVSKGKRGAHTLGRAMDISVRGVDAVRLIQEAMSQKTFLGGQYFTGFGISQKGKTRFIHLDNIKDDEKIPRPALWSY